MWNARKQSVSAQESVQTLQACCQKPLCAGSIAILQTALNAHALGATECCVAHDSQCYCSRIALDCGSWTSHG